MDKLLDTEDVSEVVGLIGAFKVGVVTADSVSGAGVAAADESFKLGVAIVDGSFAGGTDLFSL